MEMDDISSCSRIGLDLVDQLSVVVIVRSDRSTHGIALEHDDALDVVYVLVVDHRIHEVSRDSSVPDYCVS